MPDDAPPRPARRLATAWLTRVGVGAATAPWWLGGCVTRPAPGDITTAPVEDRRPGAAPVPGAASPLPDLPDAGRGAPAAADPASPPPEPREFRAAWVATVANIDWPSRPGLSTEAQRAEAQAIVDRAQQIGLNALILQVRPAADAIYPSALEPWSEVLGGVQGRAPQPAWDPLAFWVDAAHRRGLELHAWFNPYRARHSSAKSPPVAPHVAVTRPEVVRRYGDMLWMDPGEPEARALTLAVVADVVRRYDIDGVHIDDYFYPYPVERDGVEAPFPDDASWARAQLPDAGPAAVPAAPGGRRDDWRRANVDTLVQALYASVKAIKPWLRVGISPFGIVRPDRRPPGVVGFSQYDKLYADVERWLERGWLDYLAPQLYWPTDRPGQPFAVLLDSWLAQPAATPPRAVWPGLFTSQLAARAADAPAAAARGWSAREIAVQIAHQRLRALPTDASRPAADGHIHFSMLALMQDRDGVATLLRTRVYAEPALVPPLVPVRTPAGVPVPAASTVALAMAGPGAGRGPGPGMRTNAGLGPHMGTSVGMTAATGSNPRVPTTAPRADPASAATVNDTAAAALPPPPGAPRLLASPGSTRVRAEPSPGSRPARWAVWRLESDGVWRFAVLPPGPDAGRGVDVDGGSAATLVVAAVDRHGQVGARSTLRLR